MNYYVCCISISFPQIFCFLFFLRVNDLFNSDNSSCYRFSLFLYLLHILCSFCLLVILLSQLLHLAQILITLAQVLLGWAKRRMTCAFTIKFSRN